MKQKKRQKVKKDNIAYVIAGIILVVGVLILLFNGPNAFVGQATSSLVATSCDGDSVCEVAKTLSTRAGSTSNLILTSDTKKVTVVGNLAVTGGITAGSGIKVPVFLSYTQLLNYYGNTDWSTTKSANQICQDFGYQECLLGYIGVRSDIYSSTGGSCSGLLSYSDQLTRVADCTERGGPVNGVCVTGSNGDQRIFDDLVSTICIK